MLNIIINKTTKGIIVGNSKRCRSTLCKVIGLMFSKKIEDYGVIFEFEKEEKIYMHMMFVFFPIDLVFLDKYKRVIEIKENFKPFTLYTSKTRASYVIELPAGSVVQSSIMIDQVIDFD